MTKAPREKRQPLYVHGLMCESVRPEISGMQTYVGVFPPELRMGTLPTIFPNLGQVIWISWPTSVSAPQAAQIVLRLPDGTETPSGPLTLPPVPASDAGVGRLNMIVTGAFQNVMITKHGLLTQFMELDGVRYRASTIVIVPERHPAAIENLVPSTPSVR